MRKLLVGAAAAGALAITTGTALALSTQDGAGQPTSVSSPTVSSSTSSSTATPTSGLERLSAEDASRIVRERMGGRVHEVEREDEHGRAEWKVEITARDGRTYDVRIDAETGAVTRTDLDDHGGKDDHDDHDDHNDGDRDDD